MKINIKISELPSNLIELNKHGKLQDSSGDTPESFRWGRRCKVREIKATERTDRRMNERKYFKRLYLGNSRINEVSG
jgi:hypothetical protein